MGLNGYWMRWDGRMAWHEKLEEMMLRFSRFKNTRGAQQSEQTGGDGTSRPSTSRQEDAMGSSPWQQEKSRHTEQSDVDILCSYPGQRT
jgi:hypothetical protein